MGEWNADVHDLLDDRVFVLLALTSFLSITGVSMISPALPTIANTLEVSDSRIGLVVTAYTLPAIVILPFSGFAADNFGRRRIMSAGSFFVGLGGVIAILSNSFSWLLAGRVIQGVGYAGVMPLTVALLGDRYDDTKETEAQGLRTSFNKVGGILWPIVGGGLAALGWRNAFLTYLLFFPLSVLLWRRVPQSTTDDEALSEYAQSMAHVVERPRVVTYLAVGFVRFFLKYSFFTYLPLLFVARFSVGPATVGKYMAVLGVGGILSAASAGLFSERFRKIDTIIASILVIGAGTLVIVVADGLVVLLAAVALVGMADSLMGPLQKSLLTQNVDEAHRAGVVTTNSVVQNAGKTVAPAVIGALLFLDDLVWLYLVAALSFTSVLLFSVISILLRRETAIHQLVRRYRNEVAE
jgi:predicted MFS family arabinose efflux permease